MTENYANTMWERYLNAIRRTDKARIVDNPVLKFKSDVKGGVYDDLSDEEYITLRDNVEEESSFYHDKVKASSYAIFLREFRELPLSNKDIRAIASILAEATARNGPAKHSLPVDEELPFD